MRTFALGITEGCYIDLDLSKAVNGHFLITGTSGAGKSCAGQLLIRNLTEAGYTTIVLDQHRLFCPENIWQPLRNDIFVLSDEVDALNKGIPVPLFSAMQLPGGYQESNEDVAYALTGIFKQALRLGGKQAADLRRGILHMVSEGTYHTDGIAGLKDILQFVDSSSAVRVEDKLQPIFNHNIFIDGNFIKNGKINIVRLSDFDLDTQGIISEILLSYLWRKAQAGAFIEAPVWVYCDECQNLNLGVTGVLPKILSEGRKLGLNLILITQRIEDPKFKSFTQAGTQLYFKPALSDANKIAKRLSSSRYADTAMSLATLRVGECIATGALMKGKLPIKRPLKIKIEPNNVI